MTDDPASPLYYKFNFYHIPTDFEYVGVQDELSATAGRSTTRSYTMRYYNKQNFNGPTTITATSATDKLNSYWKCGNILPMTHVSNTASSAPACGRSTRRPIATRRRPIRARGSMPRCRTSTRCSARRPCSRMPNTMAVRAEPARSRRASSSRYYKQDFTQFADNGKTVGNLERGAVRQARRRVPRLAAVDRRALPAAADWSVYGAVRQGAEHSADEHLRRQGRAGGGAAEADADRHRAGRHGVEVEPRDARRGRLPHQVSERLLVDDRSRSPATRMYFLNGEAVTKGVEAESTILVGGGLAVYLNATKGTREVHRHRPVGAERAERHRDDRPHLQPGQLEPRVLQQAGRPDVQRQRRRAPGVPIDPFNITNLFFNYTLARLVAAVAVDGSGWR